jgi:hypothetical protein
VSVLTTVRFRNARAVRDTVDTVLASALGRKAVAMIRTHSRYVIIGAGIHGLSTAWHLARELRARGLGGGEDILVLDKRGPGAGRPA